MNAFQAIAAPPAATADTKNRLSGGDAAALVGDARESTSTNEQMMRVMVDFFVMCKGEVIQLDHSLQIFSFGGSPCFCGPPISYVSSFSCPRPGSDYGFVTRLASKTAT